MEWYGQGRGIRGRDGMRKSMVNRGAEPTNVHVRVIDRVQSTMTVSRRVERVHTIGPVQSTADKNHRMSTAAGAGASASDTNNKQRN